ncbi:acetate--CoA ligase [Catenovulum sediminis]|uniref:Acetate--CoA ligase n=1 Tax=Catenovulum sediminis TaxID=1740262 RepID=A0ABV1RGM4_9ALTE
MLQFTNMWFTKRPFLILFSMCCLSALSLDADAQMDDFKGSELCLVADNTLAYLNKGTIYDKKAIHGGQLNGHVFSLERVKKTLKFICQTYRQDVRAGRLSRLHDAQFIQQNFEIIPWIPNLAKAQNVIAQTQNEAKKNLLSRIPEDKILLTKYYTKLVDARFTKKSPYLHALYELPFDEQHLSMEQAEQQKDTLTRFTYTRQAVMNGALDAASNNKPLAKPILYLTEKGLHDTLLQGTAVVQTANQTRYFNVHRNNGIAYDYALNKDEQARYWYFKEVPGVMGYGLEPETKVQIVPQVSVAGNVAGLGLGKLIMLSYPKKQKNNKPAGIHDKSRLKTVSRLVILADEGGAFDDNYFQLDLLVGSYHGWADYHAANKHLPDFVQASILLLKEAGLR